MNSSTQNPHGAENQKTAMADFVRAVIDLRASASLVCELGPRATRKALIELDYGTGDLEKKILVLMVDIESSFRTIRRELSS